MKILSINYLLVLLFASACTGHQTMEEKIADRILPVTQVLAKDTILHKEYVTDIHAVQNVEIRARVSGFLDKIYVDEGKEVKKGQPLFRLNDEEYKAELAKAKANLKSAIAEAKAAELEVSKVQLLVEKKVISKTELEVAHAKLVAANARIEEARSAESNAAIRLSYTYIRSPFTGIVDRIPLKVGSLIEEGTLLTTVSDNHEIYAYFNVSENEYLQYVKSKFKSSARNNLKVDLILADGSRYGHVGTIETMDGEFEASTGSIAFRARFPNPKKLLKHGSSGKIKLSNTIKNAIIIPQKCVFEIQDKNYVFVVDSTNKVRMKNFVPQERFSHYYIVKSGLLPGETVVYEGIQNIKDGITIQPEYIAMDSLMKNSFHATAEIE